MSALPRIACSWCGSQSPTEATTCIACGAPLDVKNPVGDSGWRSAPRLRDMTELRFGNSTCQVEGEIVPVAEITLGGRDSIFFEHHVMLWKDLSVALGVMSLQGGMKRALAGMPFVVSIASGQGRIAFPRDAAGELVVMPLHPGMELDVREHAFLLSSHSIDFSYTRPIILVKPTSLLFKDTGVRMNLHFEYPYGTYFVPWRSWGNRYVWLSLTGPGRVGLQSHFEPMEDSGYRLDSFEPNATETQW